MQTRPLCVPGSCARAARLNGRAVWPPVLPSRNESSPPVTSVSEDACQAEPGPWTFGEPRTLAAVMGYLLPAENVQAKLLITVVILMVAQSC